MWLDLFILAPLTKELLHLFDPSVHIYAHMMHVSVSFILRCRASVSKGLSLCSQLRVYV